MDKIRYQDSWLFGDYLRGYEPDHIAHLYGASLEHVKMVIERGTKARREYRAPVNVDALKAAPTPKPRTIKKTTTPWMPINELADITGISAGRLLKLMHTEKGNRMGLRERYGQYRIKREHMREHITVSFNGVDVIKLDDMYMLVHVQAAVGYTAGDRQLTSRITPLIDDRHKRHRRHCVVGRGTSRLNVFVTLDGLEQWLGKMTRRSGHRRDNLKAFIEQERNHE